jgi:Ca2+-transporting ATPase
MMTVASLFVQWWATLQGYEVRMQQTMVFATLCFVQLGNALSSRSTHRMIFSRGIFSNRGMWGAIVLTVLLQLLIIYVPFLDTIFKTTVLPWQAIGVICATTIVCVSGIELLKVGRKVKS